MNFTRPSAIPVHLSKKYATKGTAVVMSGMEENDSDYKAGEISKKVYDSNTKDFEAEKARLQTKINETVDDIIVNILKKQVEIVDAQSIGKKPAK